MYVPIESSASSFLAIHTLNQRSIDLLLLLQQYNAETLPLAKQSFTHHRMAGSVLLASIEPENFWQKYPRYGTVVKFEGESE